LGKRRRARELALQFLFQLDMNPPVKIAPDEIEKSIDAFWENFKTEDDLKPFFHQLINGVIANRETIDEQINEVSENWKLDRMSVVDRNILRFAIFELMFEDDIPSNVSMNEAIEIAKKYGTADSPSFINGILDKVASNKRRMAE
jgi:N utilization substance protein B